MTGRFPSLNKIRSGYKIVIQWFVNEWFQGRHLSRNTEHKCILVFFKNNCLVKAIQEAKETRPQSKV